MGLLPFEGSPLGLSSFALRCRPDWNGCKALAAAVVNASQPCPASLGDGCALGVSQPVTSQQMYALTGELHGSPHGCRCRVTSQQIYMYTVGAMDAMWVFACSVHVLPLAPIMCMLCTLLPHAPLIFQELS